MKRAKTLLIAQLLTVGAVLIEPRLAVAQGGIPNCQDLVTPTNPVVVYMGGTTAVIPVIRLMGARLRKYAGVTLLWNENDDGCHSVSLLTSAAPTQQRIVFSYYDEVPNQPGAIIISTCNGPLNRVPDLVINDVSWTSCLLSYGSTGVPAPLRSGLKEFSGPVQGLVPIVSSEYNYTNYISVEELQDLYICGANGNVVTFSLGYEIFDYNSLSSGMRELWARGIGVKNGSALTTQIGLGSSSNITAEGMLTIYVAPTTSPNQTIGYTSTEFYDQYRGEVNALKVRGVNQNLAYWPDSDKTSTDKINIREGRYTIQGALKLVAPVDSSGVPTNIDVKHMIDWFQENPVQDPSLQLPFDVNEIYALRGVVPQCAMKVTKDGDEPVFKHYQAPAPCHCSFQVLATGKTCIPGCTACTDSSTCPTGKICSHGYCE